MAIIHIHSNDNYTAMSNRHLRTHELSWQAKGMLSFMLSCSDKYKFSLESLTQCSASGNTATRSALKELEDNGYVVRSRVTNEKGQVIEWKYDIYEEPHNATNPDVENPDVENPHVENRGQRNVINSSIINNNTFVNNLPIEEIPPIIPQGECECDCEQISQEELMFEDFRKAYKGTKRGLNTEFSNFKKKHKDWKEVLPKLLPAYERQCEQLERNKQAGAFTPQPKNLQTYINQRCWEEEVQPQTANPYGTKQRNSKFCDPADAAAAILAGIRAADTERNLAQGYF